MNQDRWTEVDRYFADLFIPEDPILSAALQDAAEAGLPPIHVAPNQGKFLSILARSVRATSVLEIGTLGAYSTIWLARALAPDGRLVTLEGNPKHAEVARRNIERAGLSDRVEIRIGVALETLARLEVEGNGPYDLVFIDADKPNYPAYLDWALKLTRPGSVIVADNVVRKGAVVDAGSPDANVQGVRRFNARVAAEKRLISGALQTVGIKGYDGFVIAYVTEV